MPSIPCIFFACKEGWRGFSSSSRIAFFGGVLDSFAKPLQIPLKGLRAKNVQRSPTLVNLLDERSVWPDRLTS